MTDLELTWDQLKERSYFGRPHVVILGAGASLAAFPSGDRFGNLLPLMNNLPEVLGLTAALKKEGLDLERGFEDIYGELAANPNLADLKRTVEERVSEYFAGLRLPDEPTIYDYLVLSLREKDYIATFNWDPFLYYACWRNAEIAKLPSIMYLHGCAVVGHCLAHRKMGLNGTRCSQCGTIFTPTRLLYPVRDKNYKSEAFIDVQWRSLQDAMKSAWLFTVFGYSAPASDAAAIELLSQAWGTSTQRELEEIEIIDVRPEEDLANSWSRFIHTHHYRTTNDYFSSLLGTFPRRTCEAMWEQNMEAKFLEYTSVPKFGSTKELQEWMARIAAYEKEELTSECTGHEKAPCP